MMLVGDRNHPEYFIILARAYSSTVLLAPSTNFNLFFKKLFFYLSNVVLQICFHTNATAKLKTVLKNYSYGNYFKRKNVNKTNNY